MSQSDSALDQMIAILGKKEDRDILARFLDGAGGNIEVAVGIIIVQYDSLTPLVA